MWDYEFNKFTKPDAISVAFLFASKQRVDKSETHPPLKTSKLVWCVNIGNVHMTVV